MSELSHAKEVAAELGRATDLFGPFGSPEQGLCIIVEEVGELAEAILKRKPFAMREEAIQVAAMAHRFLKDCCHKEAAGE